MPYAVSVPSFMQQGRHAKRTPQGSALLRDVQFEIVPGGALGHVHRFGQFKLGV